MMKNKYLNFRLLFPIVLISFTYVANFISWWNIAFYQDEFAFRILNGRFLQDGAIRTGMFSLCESWRTTIPIVFYLPAYLLSLWYLYVDVAIARFMAWGVSAFYIFSVCFQLDKKVYSLSVLALFVGVAGATLGFTRPEYLHLLNIAISFILIKMKSKQSQSHLINYVMLFILLLTFMLSVFAHVQGILFLPLNLLAVSVHKGILRKFKFIIGALIIGVSIQSLSFHLFEPSCQNAPLIQKDLSAHHHNIVDLPGIIFSDEIIRKLRGYVETFIYHDQYKSYFLPSNTLNSMQEALNVGIVLVVLLTFLFSLYYFVKHLWMISKKLITKHYVVEGGSQILTSMQLVFFVGPALLLFFINVDQNFYRNFFINGLLSSGLITAICCSNRLAIIKKSWLIFVVIVAVLSAYTNNFSVSPKLAEQQVFYGESWSYMTNIEDTKLLCDPSKLDQNGLLVDSAAYEKLKSHPNLYPIEYIYVQSIKTGLSKLEISNLINIDRVAYSCNDGYTQSICCKKTSEYFSR